MNQETSNVKSGAAVACSAVLEPQYHTLEVTPPGLICGIYFLMVGDNLMYVGKSVNLHRRLMEHREKRKYDTAIIVAMLAEEADNIELRAIKQFNPPWNRDHCNHNGTIYKRADVQEFVKSGCLITNEPYLKKRFAKMLRDINPRLSDAYIDREWQKVADCGSNDRTERSADNAGRSQPKESNGN